MVKTVQALEKPLAQGPIETAFTHHQEQLADPDRNVIQAQRRKEALPLLDLLTKQIQSQQWCILCGVSEVNGASSPRFRPVASAYTSTIKVIALAAKE